MAPGGEVDVLVEQVAHGDSDGCFAGRRDTIRTGDPHWGENGEFRVRLPAEPTAVQDRNSLRRTLLQRPWILDSGSAQWIVAAGIGHLRQHNGWRSADAGLRTLVRSVRRSI